MSTKHIRTAADLVRFDAGMRIECGGCGYARTVEGFDLVRAAGGGPLSDIATRLKCSRCGARDPKLALLSPPLSR